MAQQVAIDPITIAVVHNALLAAAREMRDTIQRTSFSPVIYEDRDFACGLLDWEAGTMAEAPGLTAFMGTLSPGIKKCFDIHRPEEMQEGDIFITSLPDYTGSHPADMMLFAPIMFEGSLIGFSASKAHLIDVGAKDPYPTDSTDAFQEGLRIPPTYLYRAGELDAGIASIIKANSRAPEVIWGDIHAQIAAFRVGESSVKRLLRKYGVETVRSCIYEIYDHAERIARETIASMPAGSWSAEDYLDDNGVDRDVPVKVVVTVTVDPIAKEITFDFTGSAPQQLGPTNAPFITAVSCSRVLGKILTAPETAACEGSFRPIKVIAPEGSIFNPSTSAPTNLYGWPMLTAAETTFKCLAPVFPDQFPACSGGDLCGILRYGIDPETGRLWFEANIEGIGQGASAFGDGESAVVHIMEACSRNLPVELEETKDPVIIERYELMPDSGGAGRFRGGLGVQRDYRLLAPLHIISILERCTAPHWGVEGGEPGGRTYGVLESSIHGTIEIKKTPATPMATGDLISIRTGGGGGFGNPLERDPEMVARDVRDGYVTSDAARSSYGVYLTEDGHQVDSDATQKERASRSSSN
jgi:N-methylhydantoinase B